MRIREILDPRHIVLDLKGSTKREILANLSGPISESRKTIEHARLVDALVEREETSTTAIADGIAIPHGKLDLGEEVICGFGRSSEGLEFESIDGNPTHLFFLLISPEGHPSLHLRWLAHLAVTLKDADFRRALAIADTPDAVLTAFDREEDAQSKRGASARS